MLLIFLFLFGLQACSAGRLQIIIPDDAPPLDLENSEFDSKSLLNFNKQVFGIGSSSDFGQKLSSSTLFEKPKALMVISVHGLNDFNYDGRTFNFTDKFDSLEIKDSLEKLFGDNMYHAEVNSSGIFGSPNFKRESPSDDEIEIEPNYQDIQNMDKLTAIIRVKDRKQANVIDYYRIHLDVSNARTDMEKNQLAENIKRGIDSLQEAIKNVTNGNVVAEIYTHESPVKEAEKIRIKALHKKFQVTQPRYIDHPATFAIAMLVCIVIFFSLLSMVWFMSDESEMGKNSLVYRLSTSRPKKD
ncbi:hypothetical protein L5515_013733 [Caenorhabditis briggsae]|uniref:Renin receptor-like C-terminal transmembrane spanning segment domain-containing protein n=2 Tax=Caenorhabditis briggsae TaxID=6238 RepID=A0AAE9E772_CAEBR|nr:hypothetical protein L5515_013733 [Caenorhabditis briggsae]